MEEKLEKYPQKSGVGKWIVLGVVVFVLLVLSQTCLVVELVVRRLDGIFDCAEFMLADKTSEKFVV